MQTILLRHGKAKSNEARADWIVGSTADLLPEGRRQAWRAAAKLGPVIATNEIYATPQPRGIQTAEIIAAKHGLDVIVDDRLKEIDKGDWKGLTVGQVMDREAAVDIDERHSFRPPNGENWDDVAKRMVDFIEQKRLELIDQIIVVTHEKPVQCAIGQLLGLPLPAWDILKINFGSIHAVKYADSCWLLNNVLDN